VCFATGFTKRTPLVASWGFIETFSGLEADFNLQYLVRLHHCIMTPHAYGVSNVV